MGESHDLSVIEVSFLEQDPVLPSAREVIHVWYIIFRDIVNIFYTGWSDCQINAISHV